MAESIKEQMQFRQDLIGTALGLFCLAMLVLAPSQIDLDVPYPFYKGPLLFPMIALSIGVFASLPSMFRLSKGFARGCRAGFVFPKKAALMFSLAVLYPVGIMLVGLEASTLVILFLELLVCGVRRPILLAGIPAGMAVLFWLVFRRLLDVYFDEPLVMTLIGG